VAGGAGEAKEELKEPAGGHGDERAGLAPRRLQPPGRGPGLAPLSWCPFPDTLRPQHGSSPRPRPLSGGQSSPQAGCSSQPDSAQGRDSPKPGGSRDQARREVGGFHLQQTASFLNGLPPDFFGSSSLPSS
jgi:hypothetical protein